eukprot:46153_1
MSTFLLLLLITKVVKSAQNACLWGNDGGEYVNINGQYTYKGNFNGAPWYKKQHGSYVDYMFLSNGYYIISREYPNNDSPIRLAQCTIASSNPWTCGFGKWEVWEWTEPGVCCSGQWVNDPDVHSTMGACPEWECDAIKTDIQYMGCDDTFPVHIGSNAWANTNGDRYFYFNYLDFRWLCAGSLSYPHNWPNTDY